MGCYSYANYPVAKGETLVNDRDLMLCIKHKRYLLTLHRKTKKARGIK